MQWGRWGRVCGTASGKHLLPSSTLSLLPCCCSWKKKEGDKKNGLRRGESGEVLCLHILLLTGLGPQMRAFVGGTCSSLYGPLFDTVWHSLWFCPLSPYSYGALQQWKNYFSVCMYKCPVVASLPPTSQTPPVPWSLPHKNISEHQRWVLLWIVSWNSHLSYQLLKDHNKYSSTSGWVSNINLFRVLFQH